jgi:phage terminase Nu1 subunit (DNA packaging protein)
MATQREVADHLGVSQPVVAKLVAAGVFQPTGRGGLDLDACRKAYLGRLREEAAGRAAHGGADGDPEELDLVAERARLAKAQADRIEMENHQTRGLVIPVEVASRMLGETLAKVRTRILAIPSECALQCASARTAPQAEAVIRRAVIDALTELSSGKEIVERAKAQRKQRGKA